MFIVASFNRVKGRNGRLEWQSLNRRTYPRTIHVVDNSATLVPKSDDEVWVCEVGRELFRNSNTVIVIVRPVEKIIDGSQQLLLERAGPNCRWQTAIELPDGMKLSKIRCAVMKGGSKVTPNQRFWRCQFVMGLALHLEDRFAVLGFEAIEPVTSAKPLQ